MSLFTPPPILIPASAVRQEVLIPTFASGQQQVTSGPPDVAHLRLVRQRRPEPLLGFRQVHVLALGIGLHLVVGDFTNGEVLATLSAEHHRRDGRRREHGKALRELHPDLLLDVHEVPHSALLSVVWLRGVARRWADALVLHLKQVLRGHVLLLAVPPVLLTHLLVEHLRKGLCEAVSNGLRHDVGVVVVLRLVLLCDLVQAEASGDDEHAHVVLDARLLGCDEVGQRHVRL
mmetsp:Transcript_40494/g.67843  ORF Transcript_40494/g.67843 Transcript_40494/m.67843 type:complete len:232 (+) Transcript_40494:195-890(+)